MEAFKKHLHNQYRVEKNNYRLGLPDSTKYNPEPSYLRELIGRAGLSQREAARRIGIGERAMRYHLSETSHSPAPYSVQYCLEALANAKVRL